MFLETLPVGQMRANCYLLCDEKNDNEAVIIDPGDDAEFIMNRIQDLALSPKLILATHGHFDHILAAMELKLAYNIPFLAHKADLSLINRMEQTVKYFIGETVGPAPKVDRFLTQKEKIKIGELFLEVIATPGHTPGSVCLIERKANIMFTGDTIFSGGARGRTDFPYSNPLKLAESIKKVLELTEETVIYPGHGEKTSVGAERGFYRFLH